MRLFGFEIGRVKSTKKGLQPPNTGNWTTIFDFNTGTWQQDASIDLDTVLTFGAVFACIRLISSDIGKLRIKLMRRAGGILQETADEKYSAVLRKPNSFQTRIKFVESWVLSKLQFGNTYALKQRDENGYVRALHVLKPTAVKPLVSDSGDVFYQLNIDRIAGITQQVTVPAREIIHDVHVTPEHPLIGVSPIGACGLSASQGLKIQSNSKNLFSNNSRPSGILTAPGKIADETAARLKASWESNYSGDNYGKTAVLGDDLKYQPLAFNAADSQLIEQLQWTAADVCRAFGVPAYKIGVGPMPAYNNIESLDQAYYSQTLQELIECIELLLDEGLELPVNQYSTEFDIERLMRMDSMTRTKVKAEKIKAGFMAPNEARAEENLLPIPGGETPYLQQQNYSLAALAKRDAKDDPFATGPNAQAAEDDSEEPDDDTEEPEDELELFYDEILKRFAA